MGILFLPVATNLRKDVVITLLPRSLALVALTGALALGVAACSAEMAQDDAGGAPAVATLEFDGAHVAVDPWESASVSADAILDVRTPAEFASGHIAGAINIDVEGANFAAQIGALDPEASYAVYCRSGNRSRVAIDMMAGLGVDRTLGLDGGIVGWADAGLPLTTD